MGEVVLINGLLNKTLLVGVVNSKRVAKKRLSVFVMCLGPILSYAYKERDSGWLN